MQQEITTINLPMPFRMGWVNCYLVRAGDGFILIDTGGSNNREALTAALEQAGCRAGSLKLIVLTHGDFDHTGNAAYLRDAFGAEIALHAGDADMGEQGDMFASRKKPNFFIRMLVPLFTQFGRAERFSPNLLLTDGYDLSAFDLDACVVAIPGHSKGSIGILTAEGDFFCGDLLDNTKEPGLTSLVDEKDAITSSLLKLGEFDIQMLYPGHGSAFPLSALSLTQ